ncbi:hypothetical protein GW17_00034257 [Ensete ventricosum]|nr:hypothetical protein GW17_00034257 [Ensete ventricosum]
MPGRSSLFQVNCHSTRSVAKRATLAALGTLARGSRVAFSYRVLNWVGRRDESVGRRDDPQNHSEASKAAAP